MMKKNTPIANMTGVFFMNRSVTRHFVAYFPVNCLNVLTKFLASEVIRTWVFLEFVSRIKIASRRRVIDLILLKEVSRAGVHA